MKRSPGAGDTFVRALVLLPLFATTAVSEAFSLTALSGVDVWLHLRPGIWILQNHAVPRTGLFSQHSALPWIAYDWGFDLLLVSAYKLEGLRALPLWLMVFKTALALAFFLLARGSWRNFWPAVLLAGVAQYSLPGLQLQPALCSILLFAIELALIFHARRTGDARHLLWVPLLFAMWANLDIGFIFGLLALVLLLVTILVESAGRRYGVVRLTPVSSLPLGMMTGITALSLVTILLTPYSYHVAAVALRSFARSPMLAYLPELGGIGFRRPQDYALLLLAMTAFFSLGLRHSRDLFPYALMLMTVLLSFPVQHHTWLVVVASVAVIADAIPTGRPEPAEQAARLLKKQGLLAAGIALAGLLVAISLTPRGENAMMNKVARTFPVGACDYIRDHNLPGPLFNAYEWGGFVTWYLPDHAVAIDSRNDLYGNQINLRYFQLTHGEVPLSSDPSFVYAGTILLPRNSPMAVALGAAPQFKVMYSDDVATVLAPER